MLVACILVSALGALVMCLLVVRYGLTPEPTSDHRDLLVIRLGHAVAGTCFATTAILAAVLLARAPAPAVPSAVAAPDARVSDRLAALDRERQALREHLSALGETVQTLRDQVGAVGGNMQGMRARLDQAETRLARLGDEAAQMTARRTQAERAVAARPAAAPIREPVLHPMTPSATRIAPVYRAPAPEAVRASDSTSASAVETTSPGPARSVAAVAPAAPAAPPAPPVVAVPKPSPAGDAPRPQSLPSPTMRDKVRTDWEKIRQGFASAGDDISSAVRGLGLARRGSGRD